MTVLRARALAKLARERGFTLAPAHLESFRAKLARDQRLFGDCVDSALDPLAMD